MKKIIEVDIRYENDLYDKYNRNRASSELINYIIDNAYPYIKAESILIVINNYLNKDIECKKLIDEGLRREFDKSIRRHQKNNLSQISYFILGVITLFLATLISEGIIKELMVIGGWVFIWELVEVELFSEVHGIKKRRLIKKMLKSPIEERKINF